jgi:hypothetical protein
MAAMPRPGRGDTLAGMKSKHVAALVALGLAVATALALLWRGSTASGEGPASAASASGAAPGSATASSSTGAVPGSGSPATRPQLAQPAGGATAPAAVAAMGSAPSGAAQADDAGTAPAGPRVYVREDGVLVRDHRSGNPPMRTAPIRRPRRNLGAVEPTTVIAVRNAMRPIVYRCTAEIPAAGMEADPRLQGEVVISIAAEYLTVDDVKVQIAHVQGAAESKLRDCVVQGVSKIAFDVPGATAVTDYTLTLPFRLRQ